MKCIGHRWVKEHLPSPTSCCSRSSPATSSDSANGPVGHLFLNAMNQEQGNIIVNDNRPSSSETLLPQGCNARHTKVRNDIPSSD
jgi:hypothetical protein